MIRLTCKDHGFDCDFEAEGENMSEVMGVFGHHTTVEHGVRYADESLTQFIVGQTYPCPYCKFTCDDKELLSRHIDKIHNIC